MTDSLSRRRTVVLVTNLGFWTEDCSTHVKLLELCWNTSSLGMDAARHWRKSAEEAEDGRKKVQLKEHKIARTSDIFVDSAIGRA
ncbi:hypothetical protein PR202_ga21933 [Eleusine coracana subsp. coracana]|uniref:Uncharacterized protein n=1 Tax=Eleusine coracana subsp. coracana TaxID=191504 RepID=A0AAV5D284_ELECO|nr:hypothetical protein PR202_ga21933 [Eleusine coracana subsp. coracana]